MKALMTVMAVLKAVVVDIVFSHHHHLHSLLCRLMEEQLKHEAVMQLGDDQQGERPIHVDNDSGAGP